MHARPASVGRLSGRSGRWLLRRGRLLPILLHSSPPPLPLVHSHGLWLGLYKEG